MKKRKDSDAPIGKLTVIDDFLPPPEKLVPREESRKITIALSRDSIDFYKRKARETGTKYQRMIRSLVERYARHHAEKS